MADTYSPTLVSKSNEVNSATNPIFNAITDGVDTALVDATGNLQVLVNNGAGAAAVNIQDGGNSITVDGTVAVSSVAGNVTVVQPTGTNLHVVVDSGTIVVTATDLDIRDLTLAQDAVRVSANTSANSAVNPIFVSFTQSPITGEVHSYNTAAAVAAGASSNHDYTVVTAFLLKSVEASNSGGMKIEVQTGPVAGLTTKWVGFIPLAGGNSTIKFDPPIEVPTTGTGTVRVIRTNRNFVAVDVYSTIIGIDA